ncbi:hypothetical protein [Actinospongicola halichondriae]|uniref:hypothetical protein n=1 Tax=Actinospongicola halichondriae TaxID=3236844 RepID=UPI003D4C1A2C
MSETKAVVAPSARTGRFAAEADAQVAAVADDPTARYRLAESFYVCHPGEGWHSYGASELAFLKWEIHRGVLDPVGDAVKPGSAWWRAVNAELLRDAIEARLMFDAGDTEPGSTRGVRAWQRFLADPHATSWYRAHNTSIALGYLHHVASATDEEPHEQKLMSLTLTRVLYAQAIVEDHDWALGHLSRVARWFFRPSASGVSIAMHVPDLSPQHYPLRSDLRRRTPAWTHLGDPFIWFVDHVLIGSRLDQLYDLTATSLDLPELRRLSRSGVASYPWGHGLRDPEVAAISVSDFPSPLQRRLGRLFGGRA